MLSAQLTNFEKDYEAFIQRLNKQAVSPAIKGDAITAITAQAKELTSELRNAAKAAQDVGTRRDPDGLSRLRYLQIA